MNTMSLAVLAIASSLAMLLTSPAPTNIQTIPLISKETDNVVWDQHAVNWLLEAQSPNGGWGAGSHSYQNVTDPHAVQTDPATTAFAAMALLKSGGPLKSNPYQKEITNALNRILKDIDGRPDNGRITSLTGTQPQVKLGIHIDASMALQFLTDIREQINDSVQEKEIDQAAEVCIHLIQGSQNADGGWAGGGWAPVLQSAMANNALEGAQERYVVDEKAILNSRQYQADNISETGVRSEDAAGVPLYAAASAQRATSAEAREMESLMTPGQLAGFSSGKIKKDEIIKDLETKGVDRDNAERLVKSYEVNQSSTKTLQSDDIWNGFGNNGGEEYLSYMMTSEALAQQGKDAWLKWRQSIEPKFKQSQNPNGSWSGQHCITSPVFCTAAILQAWHAGL
ncbi:MAG: hypothetical protein SH808_00445 [Saprospiraceae bacterium]|nr:hypothetical protein [Saprospiraceae bacterium]